jgi:hypothetical protein
MPEHIDLLDGYGRARFDQMVIDGKNLPGERGARLEEEAGKAHDSDLYIPPCLV